MTDASKLDYAGAFVAARKGDEDAFQFLYNQTVLRCRSLSMLYFDPATAKGRVHIENVVRKVYTRLYDAVKTLDSPEELNAYGAELTRHLCLKEWEKPLSLAVEPEDLPETLVTAEECRLEERGENAFGNGTIGELVLSTLHTLTSEERVALVRWNHGTALQDLPKAVLHSAFVKTEKAVMEQEERTGIKARYYAKSRLAFFNRLLDLYTRFYEASSKQWETATEPQASLALSGGTPEASQPSFKETNFESIWESIREGFYLENVEDEYEDAFDAPEETAEEETAPKGLLSRWWVRALAGLLIVLLVLLFVVATAGQHTSHATALVSAGLSNFADFENFGKLLGI